MKKLINGLLKTVGLRLSRIPVSTTPPVVTTTKANDPRLSQQTMTAALYRMRERGLKPSTVIDVGASNGCWSEKCMTYFPESYYFLVEAQAPHQPDLDKFKAMHKNVDFTIAAAGDKKGDIYFDASDMFGGLASDKPFEKNNIVVPVNSIDNWVADHNLKPPYVIKLDTHGYEVPIINGAVETLKKTELIIVEVYNYRLQDNALRFYEFCDYMERQGFRPVEAVDLMQRKKDNSFWQMDLFFVPKTYVNIDYPHYE